MAYRILYKLTKKTDNLSMFQLPCNFCSWLAKRSAYLQPLPGCSSLVWHDFVGASSVLLLVSDVLASNAVKNKIK